MYRSHLFGKPSIITCSAATNKYILQSPEDFPVKWPAPELVGHTCLVNVEGERHARLRNFVINTINHPNALRRIVHVVQPRVVAALRNWADKGTINAFNETKKVTFHNISQMFASIGPGTVQDEIEGHFTGLIPGLRAFPLNIPGSTYRYALKCRQRLTEVFRQELEKRRQKEDENCTDEGADLMDGLMRIQDKDGHQLSDIDVIDNIISLIIAGYESTSVSLMWALYHLSRSPMALQKLREENADIKKANKADFITMDDISKLKYTSKVVEETIRMANVALGGFRIAARDIEYGGYIILKGWQIIVWFRHLHTDAKNFDDPLSFKPERWDNSPKPGTFQVFGAGPRICAGNMLVRVQLTILLHHLSLGYRYKNALSVGR